MVHLHVASCDLLSVHIVDSRDFGASWIEASVPVQESLDIRDCVLHLVCEIVLSRLASFRHRIHVLLVLIEVEE